MMFSNWLGKILGAIFGYLIAGPIGAVIGVIIGNFFDKGVALQSNYSNAKFQAEQHARIQKVFFEVTFTVMGHVAKADGRVSENEIRMARQVMRRMQLNPDQKRQAIRYFTEGKQANFDLNRALARMMAFCAKQPALLRMFVEIQYQAASADGGSLGRHKQNILYVICQRLGFAPIFTQYQEQSYSYQSQNRQQASGSTSSLSQSYALLEISETASKAEVKKAFRKQMSLHHPDKLIAQGLPEQMIKIATEKTQKIQAAYEQIKKSRGF